MPRKNSFITCTDQFCGAGGSSLGAIRAGVEVKLALNHWKLACETYNTNHQETLLDCTDISACDPRRYPSTDILITSPECTNHSLAKGKRRKGLAQSDLFAPRTLDPAEERSRATMWDVPRFAEFHGYSAIIVENVVDARHWVMYDAWLHAMHSLGYQHREVFLNSMFCHPTPQSRDRMYVVFWRQGNHAPDLDIRRPAWCLRCAENVEAVQSWKNPRKPFGRYGSKNGQYVYRCPRCAEEVSPYYYAALNAIDWTIPAERIGDRPRPLKERTLARIRYGLEKFGRQPLQIITNMTTDGGRVRTLMGAAFTQTGSALTALVHPYLVETMFSHAPEGRARSVGDPMPTQSTRLTQGLCVPPAFLTTAGSRETDPRSLAEAVPTLTGSDRFGVAFAPAALVTLRDMKRPDQLVRGLDGVLSTQVAAGQQEALVSRSPYLVSYYGQNQASGLEEAVTVLTTKDRHALVGPSESLDVEDCYFRMLQPHEIGAGMAFPADYVVLGNKRDQVKQLGNAVTPPAMDELMGRVVASLC